MSDAASSHLPARDGTRARLRTATLLWLAGAYFLILGISLIILTPGTLGPLLGLRITWLRGALTAAGGLALFWVAGASLRRPVATAILLLAAAPQLLIGIEYARLGVFSAAATLILFALGVVVAALIPSARTEDGPRPDLAGFVLGGAQAAQGLDLLLRPGAAVSVPTALGVPATTVGAIFLVVGLLVIVAQAATRAPRPFIWAAHLAAGLALLALWMGQSALLDPIYWVLGAAVVLRALGTMFLPWLSDSVLLVDRNSLRVRLGLSLVTAGLIPVLAIMTVALENGLMTNSTPARQVAFALTLGAALICGLLGVLVARRLTHPIDQVVAAADRLAAGERPVTIEARGPTEIRRLGAAVTALTTTLDARAEERARLARETAALGERQRLARDLHDSVSQALFGINLSARSGLKHIENPDTARARLEQVLTLAAAAQAEMRALIFELRPDQLQTDGLVKALELQTFALQQRREFEVEALFCSEPDVSLPVKEAFYRIAQEAINNALKHARPNRLTVELAHGNKVLTLRVRDDGRGFDPDATYPGHFGLHSMRERAAQIGAAIRIESQKQGGTSVHLTYGL